LLILNAQNVTYYRLCAFAVFSHARAISSEAAAAAAAASAAERSSNGLKAGIVLFSSAQQLQQDKSPLVGDASAAAAHSSYPSSNPLPQYHSESSVDLSSPPSSVIGDIVSINGQVGSMSLIPQLSTSMSDLRP
jgi:hypothetical protein